MANFLVTGRAGSGKSTVAIELSGRGLEAFDADDIPGLSNWEDISTGDKVTLNNNRYVDIQKLQWIWDRKVLFAFLANLDGAFICGGADNDFSFEDLFAKHFVLDVNPETQIERIETRASNDYGKDPSMFTEILKKQNRHIQKAHARNAIIIDANQPIKAVVDAIAEYLQ